MTIQSFTTLGGTASNVKVAKVAVRHLFREIVLRTHCSSQHGLMMMTYVRTDRSKHLQLK